MNNLFNKAMILSLCLMVVFASCKSDDDVAVSINFESDYIFFTGIDQTEMVSFTTENVNTIEVTAKPKGWSAEVDIMSGILTVSSNTTEEVDPAAAEEEEIAKSGAVTVKGTSASGETGYKTIYVAIAGEKDLTSMRSNSYLVTEKMTNYSFDATKKGETSDVLSVDRVALIWQSQKNLLKNIDFRDGYVSFFVDQNDDDELSEGNAIIGAYDLNGDVIWSWHIWVVEAASAEKTISIGAKTFMDINLGAFMSTNVTEENVWSKDNILDSYGLYYQWGRKDPFSRPLSYNAAGSNDGSLYSDEGDVVKITYAASTDKEGTQNYAVAHPLTFILGVEESKYDWLYSDHSASLWSSTSKSVNDPCPKGWRVPSTEELNSLTIANIADGKEDSFGWNLTDATNGGSSFFVGAGRRVYKTGRIQNVYIPRTISAQPWEGLYWTANDNPNNMSSAFYFFYNIDNPATSSVEPSVAHYRANGMQIRCVQI